MQNINVVNLLPYLISLSISIALGFFSYKRRHVAGAWSFSLIILIEVLTTIGYILELITPGLPGKMFWDNFQWFTSLIYPVALLLFSFEYRSRLKPKNIRWTLFLLAISLFLAAAISFDFFPGLGILSPRLIQGRPFTLYTYQLGSLTLLAALFTYLVTLFGIGILIRETIRQAKYFRTQTFIIILGIAIPVMGSILVVSGIELFPNRDIAPITFALANLIVVYGLFHFRLFDIVPVARNMVMDYMNDPAVILDHNDLILDGNPAFEKWVETKKKTFLHKPLKQFVSSTVIQNTDRSTPVDAQEEGLIYYGDSIGYFDVSNKIFTDRLGAYSGRLIILHDLTTRKLNENELLLEKDILEENVSIRALELEQLNSLLVSEVAERKKAEKEKDNYAQEMEVLFNLAIEISELPAGEDIEEFLARRIKEINRAFFVVLSEYDAAKKMLYPKHIIMDENAMKQVVEIIGEDPREIYLRVDDTTYQRITNEVVLYRQSLNQAFYGVIDPKVGERIQEVFSIDQFVGVSLKSNGELAASLVIALQKNNTVPSAKFYESLANLVSVAFWRK